MPREAGMPILLCHSSFDDKISQQCALPEGKKKLKKGQEGTAICSDQEECSSEGWYQMHELVWQQNCSFPEIVKEYQIPGVKGSEGDCGAGGRM